MNGERKTSLTPQEKITAAFMHYVRMIDQQDIAILMGGVNMARVNDACRDIGIAVKLREPPTVAVVKEPAA